MDLTGVVLCGGRSSRMGRDKALLPVGGTAMARRVADALAEAGAEEIVALGGDLEGLAELGLRAVADASPGDGPFPATIHALELATRPVVLVVSCDLVAPDPAAMRAVVDQLTARPDADGAVPLVDGHLQWTHAAWRPTAAPTLRAARDRGIGSLRRGTEGLTLVEVTGLPPAAVHDADVPEDLPDAP